MKTLTSLSFALAVCLVPHARGNSGEEKEEMKQAAAQYRECAKENKSAKLDECEENAPPAVKTAATKAVANRQKLGEVEEKLAAAYDAGDKKLIQQLNEQKSSAELECELSDKEKRAAYVISNVDELVQSVPTSEEAKQLKVKTETNLKAYIDNAKKLMELQKEQMRLENGMESVDYSIEIIRKREELKQLEKEAAEK